MPLAPIFKRAYWSLVVGGALYFAFLSSLLNGWVQRQALYAHKVQTKWWQDPNKPEQFGFLKNQVRPFNINTSDGIVLYSWHILPIALYTRNEQPLLYEPAGLSNNVADTLAFKLLSTDPESRLVINFHGNAGTVAQGWRTDTYRALSSSASDKIHVLTVDYRGFGYSTGSPTEKGVIADGITLVDWAMNVAGIPPERIILFGQSLGTAVAAAVAEHFIIESQTEFAGIVLVASFSDIPTLMTTYAVGGIIPILSPLRPYPTLQKFFANHIQETWKSVARVENLVRRSRNLDLRLIHARNDFDIPWTHSTTMFHAAANGTTEHGMSNKQIDSAKTVEELGEGAFVWRWKAGNTRGEGLKRIKLEVVQHGGHNRLPTYSIAAKAVMNIFDI
ncbi:MICOS complex subunit mic60 [Physcia stellaris]|nr:MICOS complex subunit mic60 [Physcia stellaris]